MTEAEPLSHIQSLDACAFGSMDGRTMRALASSLLVIGILVGCADPPAVNAPSASAANKPPPSEARYAELGPEECQAWADQFSTRLKEATKRRIDECSARVKAAGGTPASDEKDLVETNAEADRLRALIVDQCGQQLGASYVRADAQCYMSAKKMEDWKSCDFQSMFFADYKSVAKNHEQMFDDRCRTQLQQVAGGSAASAG
jgi:hypothetical protein